jgi:hypothetical protein
VAESQEPTLLQRRGLAEQPLLRGLHKLAAFLFSCICKIVNIREKFPPFSAINTHHNLFS